MHLRRAVRPRVRRDDQEQLGGIRRRYRAVDVLLIDDVQFVARMEGFQEELFHIFNGLFRSGTQLVLTCDDPRSIPTLAERLRNRFSAGLLAELQTPDLETRLEILRGKAEREKVAVPDDMLELLARGLQRSIRELGGALGAPPRPPPPAGGAAHPGGERAGPLRRPPDRAVSRQVREAVQAAAQGRTATQTPSREQVVPEPQVPQLSVPPHPSS